MSLNREDIERAKFTFSIYDFDGTDRIDAFQLGNALRALGLYPTLKKISSLGGSIRRNEKTLSLEEFLAIYQEAKKDRDKDEGSLEDYLECLKSHDKDNSGKLSVAQLGHLLQAYGEKLDRDEVDEIIKECGYPYEDMVDYKMFLKNLLRGPENKASSPVREIRRERPPPSVTTTEDNSEPGSLTPLGKDKQNETPERRASTDVSATSDTSGGDISKSAVPKSAKVRKNSGVKPEVKEEPVKAKFQQPLISLKTGDLFGKKK
ncbi:Myosin light chain alkali [Orchesella cincta]|uniref:Myosin light chain alkali n=1 Tax=Orchesella cincta TaxID=48709 RepID=A0A1D2N7K8_ORCCI|nr:Myosin light chain alkali [Orchesella cincta]